MTSSQKLLIEQAAKGDFFASLDEFLEWPRLQAALGDCGIHLHPYADGGTVRKICQLVILQLERENG